jgi:hypothetical protein
MQFMQFLKELMQGIAHRPAIKYYLHEIFFNIINITSVSLRCKITETLRTNAAKVGKTKGGLTQKQAKDKQAAEAEIKRREHMEEKCRITNDSLRKGLWTITPAGQPDTVTFRWQKPLTPVET